MHADPPTEDDGTTHVPFQTKIRHFKGCSFVRIQIFKYVICIDSNNPFMTVKTPRSEHPIK